jgi:UDP-N-acetylmuramoylalanine--D-glutamate ligase
MGSTVTRDVSQLNRASDWSEIHVGVIGLGVAGYACADSLTFLNAHVVAIDERDTSALREKQQILETLGAKVVLGEKLVLPKDIDVLVVSPGIPPTHEVIQAALAAEIPVWGELELAWRLRDLENPAPWLCVTGTNGKTTTTLMLESMLLAAGLRATAAGNIGRSLVEVVMDPDGYDVIAVEVGAPQLPFVYSMSPLAAACLNIAEDHVDHFGSMEQYVQTKAKVFERTQKAAIFNCSDKQTIRMVENADVIDGCRAIGFTLGSPGLSELGLVEDILVDRAFVDNRQSHAQELAVVGDVHPTALHNVANALAAAALARAFGVAPVSIKKGLQDFQPAAHRVALVAVINDVRYINDSKATNAHAAQTALRSFENVIWIAGGDSKGQNFDELVKLSHSKMKAAILLGRDREYIRSALDKFGESVPVIDISDSSINAMQEAVRIAHGLATPGDVVLLAPACASWDMFQNYGHRGDLFAEAVSNLGEN